MLSELGLAFTPFLRGVDVGRRLVIRVSQQRDDANHDRLNGVYRQPALLCPLIAILVLARVMQYRYTNVASLRYVRMPDFSDELQLRWFLWIIWRESEASLEKNLLHRGYLVAQ